MGSTSRRTVTERLLSAPTPMWTPLVLSSLSTTRLDLMVTPRLLRPRRALSPSVRRTRPEVFHRYHHHLRPGPGGPDCPDPGRAPAPDLLGCQHRCPSTAVHHHHLIQNWQNWWWPDRLEKGLWKHISTEPSP